MTIGILAIGQHTNFNYREDVAQLIIGCVAQPVDALTVFMTCFLSSPRPLWRKSRPRRIGQRSQGHLLPYSSTSCTDSVSAGRIGAPSASVEQMQLQRSEQRSIAG